MFNESCVTGNVHLCLVVISHFCNRWPLKVMPHGPLLSECRLSFWHYFVGRQWQTVWRRCQHVTDNCRPTSAVTILTLFSLTDTSARVSGANVVGWQAMPYFWLMSAVCPCRPTLSVAKMTNDFVIRQWQAVWRSPNHWVLLYWCSWVVYLLTVNQFNHQSI